MNRIVEKNMKAGVAYLDMHKLAEKILMKGLVKLGILKGDIDEMIEKRIPYLFQPHGLGHLIGLDTHDVGGYLPNTPPRLTVPGYKILRCERILEDGMALTVEQGCYFVEFLLNEGAKKLGIPTDCINMEEVKKYLDFGGVRIEDEVVIEKTGSRF